ncbi:MAG TPA: chorismate-binding protein [Ruania sp.]|nr:chorismate-binding protein [Ruania sp.]
MSHSRGAAHRPVAQARRAAPRAAPGDRRAGANGVRAGVAQFAGVRGEGVLDYADLSRAPDALDAGGWWALAGEFGGPVHAWRFARVEVDAEVDQVGQGGAEHDGGARLWSGPPRDLWSSSMDRSAYLHAVQATQAAIREGEVYQANICRMLSAPVPDRPDAAALAAVLDRGNPAPYAGYLDVPPHPDGAWPSAWAVTASPELSFAVEHGRIHTGPIKGTGRTPTDLGDKDRAENVMITDLVRNDLQRICDPGTVAVTALLATEQHPGLVHLVSRVRGTLSNAPVRWGEVLAALHPPGSTSGAPKSSALHLIDELEPVPRGVYCGQLGWIDADAQTARLAVAIRTFTWADGQLQFGTGAGITFGSDPAAEWSETELKAANLVALASC